MFRTYRVVRKEVPATSPTQLPLAVFQIRQAHVSPSEPTYVSDEPAYPAGLSLEDLRAELHAMLRALDRDIINDNLELSDENFESEATPSNSYLSNTQDQQVDSIQTYQHTFH